MSRAGNGYGAASAAARAAPAAVAIPRTSPVERATEAGPGGRLDVVPGGVEPLVDVRERARAQVEAGVDPDRRVRHAPQRVRDGLAVWSCELHRRALDEDLAHERPVLRRRRMLEGP
ncbi:hypothetical protein M768_15755 [Cellulosimicrobium cellulans F16]|uniref:Uncharacterized protein n=1 Tax=Cellulosimicrobium cellulans F16 TaxID=1350482 RepID=A0A0M0F4C4_CELCE|nr:hypothetical protein M768_15755 [Cellulosimicrobium cellulans F16]